MNAEKHGGPPNVWMFLETYRREVDKCAMLFQFYRRVFEKSMELPSSISAAVISEKFDKKEPSASESYVK